MNLKARYILKEGNVYININDLVSAIVIEEPETPEYIVEGLVGYHNSLAKKHSHKKNE